MGKNYKDDSQKYYFECACNSDEHRLVFYLSDDPLPEDREIHTSVYLNHTLNVFGRIKEAIKYIFGHRSKYGSFDSFILKPEDVGKFKEMLNKYEDILSKEAKDFW
jgi:hypothetical protein